MMNQKIYESIQRQDQQELIQIFEKCEQEIANWENKFKYQQNKIIELQSKMKESNNKLFEQKQELQTKDDQILEKDQEIEILNQQIDKQTVKLQDAKLSLNNLESQLKVCQSQLNEVQSQNKIKSSSKSPIRKQVFNNNVQIQNQNQTQIQKNISLNSQLLTSTVKNQNQSVVQPYQGITSQQKQFIQKLIEILNNGQFEQYLKANKQQEQGVTKQIIDSTQNLILKEVNNLINWKNREQAKQKLFKKDSNKEIKSSLSNIFQNQSNTQNIQQKDQSDYKQQSLQKQQNPKQKKNVFRNMNDQEYQDSLDKYQIQIYPMEGSLTLNQIVVNGLDQLFQKQSKINLLILAEQNNQYIYQQKYILLVDFMQTKLSIRIPINADKQDNLPKITINLVFQDLKTMDGETIFQSIQFSQLADCVLSSQQQYQFKYPFSLLEDQKYRNDIYRGTLQLTAEFKKY